jgi:hypothetical protein
MRILGSGDAVLAVGSARVYVLALPSFQQLQVANIPTGFQTLQAAFKHSPDGRWVAVTIGDGQRAATLFASKDAIRTAPDGGDVAWTRDSRRAAVIGAARGYLLDVAAGTGVPVAQGGFGPNWSDDGAYVAFGLATAASGGNDAISVVDGSSGVEVLRVYGPKACVPTGVQWGPQNTIRAAGSRNAEKAFVQVPGGQFLKQAPPDIRPPAPTPPAPPDVRLPPGVALVQPLTWLSEHDWRDGRASNGFVLSEGGGKDFCLEEPADASVVLPPFTPDRLPSPAPAVTPTVTRSPS